MSENAPPREQRMVHILRPRFELSPLLSQEILEFVEPTQGRVPTILGAYATREIILDANSFHSGKYGQELSDQYHRFERYTSHILFGDARHSRNQNKPLPPAIQLRQTEKGSVKAALRPRHQETFDEKIVGMLDFKRFENNERLRPYGDKQPKNHRNYIVVEIGGAALRSQFKDEQGNTQSLSFKIKEFTEAIASMNGQGPDYYATTSEIKGHDEPRLVEIRNFPPPFSDVEPFPVVDISSEPQVPRTDTDVA